MQLAASQRNNRARIYEYVWGRFLRVRPENAMLRMINACMRARLR